MEKERDRNSYFYEVGVRYGVVLPVGEGGAPVEVEKDVTVRVLRLKRTNRQHSRFAMAVMRQGGDMDGVADVAEMFVECAVDCDAKLKKEIQGDLFACTNIYYNERVQEDIEGFLLKLDFVRQAKEGGMRD